MIRYGAIVAREEEKRVRNTLSNGGENTTARPIRTITTAEAKITTVEVTIQTITINKRQMTLSVFRQLQERNVIDPETYQLRGVPWGTVNYFFGDCEPNHLHVVWQDGGKLWRSCTYSHSPAFDGLWKEEKELAEDLAILRIREGWVPPDREKMHVQEPGLCDVPFNRYGVDRKQLMEMWWSAVHPNAASRPIAEEDLSWLAQKYGRLMNAAEFKDTVLTTFARRKAADTERYLATYQRLKDLDQLFIAV